MVEIVPSSLEEEGGKAHSIESNYIEKEKSEYDGPDVIWSSVAKQRDVGVSSAEESTNISAKSNGQQIFSRIPDNPECRDVIVDELESFL